MTDLNPREFARTRLLAAAQGVHASDLLPDTSGHLATPDDVWTLAYEFEAVTLGLLAVIRTAGMDMVGTLQNVFLALDGFGSVAVREDGPE